MKVRHHPKAYLVNTAVLTNNSTVAAPVRAALAVQGGGYFNLFTNEAEAIT